MYPTEVKVLLLQPELSVPCIPLQCHTALTLCSPLHSAHLLQKYSTADGVNYFFFSASLLTSPEAWYRFGASLETIADVLPGPYLEDCSRSHCILSGCSPRDLLQVASGPILLLLTCVSPEGMLAVAWPPYLCLLL